MKNPLRIVVMSNLALALVAGVVASLAEAATVPMTAEQKAALRKERREKRLAESGGLVERDVPGKSALIVNAQSAVPMECIIESTASIRGLSLVKVEVATGDPSKAHRPTPQHPVVVSVVNDVSSDVTLLVAPEQNWAELNVRLLLQDNPTDDVVASRLHKELWRAILMAMGAANSMSQPCLLKQINTLRELDRTKTMLPSPQPISNMIDVADKLGIVRVHKATYRKACKEGWAPEPTNDVQRAIWEETRKLPEKPIQIKFDPKKGR